MKASQLQKFLAFSIRNKLPVLVKGIPAIGKTEITYAAAEETKNEIYVEHPVVSDPTDFKGLPFPKNGVAEFLPYGSLAKLRNATVPTVYFVDDLGQAPTLVQAAFMQLFLARRIGDHKVSDFVTFVAATNRRADKAGVGAVLEPLKSRFVSIVELEYDWQEFKTWLIGKRAPTSMISFGEFKRKLMCDFKPTGELTNSSLPRTIWHVCKLQAAGVPADVEYEAFTGAAGEGFAAEYLAFLKVFRSLPDPDEIIKNPTKIKVPEDPAVMYSLCGSLAAKANTDTIANIVVFANRMPDEFSVLLIKDCLAYSPDIAKKQNQAFVQWTMKHKHVIL